MQQLLRDVAAGKWAGVDCTEVERLARGNTMDQGRVAETFQFSHTKIITLSKTYDPDNEFDTEYFEFGLFMARREYKSINRRIQAGRKQSVLEGRYIYSRPAYGYRKVKIQGDKGFTLAIDPEEAEVVRRISPPVCPDSRRAGGHRPPVDQSRRACGSVRHRLERRPVLHRMLTNEVYLGMIRDGHGKQVRVLEDGEIRKKRLIQKDYTLVPRYSIRPSSTRSCLTPAPGSCTVRVPAVLTNDRASMPRRASRKTTGSTGPIRWQGCWSAQSAAA